MGYPDRCSLSLWRDNWNNDDPYTSPYTKCDHSPYRNSYCNKVAYTGSNCANDIERIINEFKPTHIVYPHFYDCHVDHFTANNFIKYVIAKTGIDVVELTYLVHRGHWPAPPGAFSSLSLTPPQSLWNCGVKWFSLHLSSDDIREKGKCLREYRSQNKLNRIYLQSFLRRNELFGQYDDIDINLHDVIQNKVSIIELTNPSADTLKGYLHASADISNLTIKLTPKSVECIMTVLRKPKKNYKYIFDLIFFRLDKAIRRYVLCVENGILSITKPTTVYPTEIGNIVKYSIGLNNIGIKLTIQNIDEFSSIFVNALTRMGDILIDRTGSRLIKLRS